MIICHQRLSAQAVPGAFAVIATDVLINKLPFLVNRELLLWRVKGSLRVKSEVRRRPSAALQLNFRVDGKQFGACVVDAHLPVDATLGGVDVADPSERLLPQGRDITEATTLHALTRQTAQFVLRDVRFSVSASSCSMSIRSRCSGSGLRPFWRCLLMRRVTRASAAAAVMLASSKGS